MTLSITRIHRVLHAIFAGRLVINLRRTAATPRTCELCMTDNGNLSDITFRVAQESPQKLEEVDGRTGHYISDLDRDS